MICPMRKLCGSITLRILCVDCKLSEATKKRRDASYNSIQQIITQYLKARTPDCILSWMGIPRFSG
ncbi:hypothetical protein GCK32_019153 [Trichostrongylus colubriformis]|uniref:Uncharacterized protein n=1 Tax=Trichostrongylus colubriformis TaxID=6319 RepID=A0AAN8FCQ2_TRICO